MLLIRAWLGLWLFFSKSKSVSTLSFLNPLWLINYNLCTLFFSFIVLDYNWLFSLNFLEMNCSRWQRGFHLLRGFHLDFCFLNFLFLLFFDSDIRSLHVFLFKHNRLPGSSCLNLIDFRFLILFFPRVLVSLLTHLSIRLRWYFQRSRCASWEVALNHACII